MAHFFYHHPASALLEARQRRFARALRPGPKVSSVSRKWHKYAITPELLDALNDPVGEEVLQDTDSHAVALVASHPELFAGEPNSAAHIQTNIIATQPATELLGQIIADQGPATPEGGWATQTPLINPATDQPYRNSQGQIQYVPLWSETTGQFAGQAIIPSLDDVKDDPDLGVNITDIDPNDPTAPTNGAIWTLHDGMPTVDHTPTGLLAETALDYQLENQSPDYGYSLTVDKAIFDNGKVMITFTAKNWYTRWLSLHVRYLDGNKQPIPLSKVEEEIKDDYPNWQPHSNHTYDAFLDMLQPQFVVMGIPVGSSPTFQKTVPVPAEAVSVQILAGGLGPGANHYPDTVAQGTAMTAVFNFAVPPMLVALMAASGYAALTKELQNSATLRNVLTTILGFLNWGNFSWGDGPGFVQDMAIELGTRILDEGNPEIARLMARVITGAEATQAVEDAIPFIGPALSAIWSVNLLAQLVRTSVQVFQSPRTYVSTIKFTHVIKVTIAHDPENPAGFPATATHFIVTATFDGGTPRTLRQTLPAGTVTAPRTVTFTGVPAGGKVQVNVDFYSNTDFLVGHGSVDSDNIATQDVLSLAITIKEILVPLTTNTKYSHKEIIVLDSNGNHQWHATTPAPTVVTPEGLCENVNGHICAWTGITVSTVNAAVGYAWQAYNTAVHDCTSGAVGQLSQFANLSITQNPQSKYLFSGCGFSGTTRIVYDLLDKPEWNFYLDPTNGGNFIRQIRLTDGNASFDDPKSNKAWGKLQLDSDALLLHPQGTIISVNTEFNKLEVLELPSAATTDANAPLSQVRSGVGTREGLMKGPVLAAVTAKGTILVLESENNRIQAFDLKASPVPYFANDAYFVPLHDVPTAYLDIAIEHGKGYIYVLSYAGRPGAYVYRLDIYTPEGAWLARTTGVNAAKLAVNAWRDLFTLNYQVLKLPNGTIPNKTEPSVSHWIPSTPNPLTP